LTVAMEILIHRCLNTCDATTRTLAVQIPDDRPGSSLVPDKNLHTLYAYLVWPQIT
jgi:hypothetical protein